MTGFSPTQESFFDDLAEAFAARYENNPAFALRRKIFVEEAGRFLALARPESEEPPVCLDLGCGPGVIAASIARLGFRVIGIDGSGEMVALAAKLAAEEGWDEAKARFVQADIVGFLRDSPPAADFVVSSSVLEYLERPEEVVEKVARLLSPGGRFVFSVPNRRSILRKIEPVIQPFLPARSRYLGHSRNRLRVSDYLAMAGSAGLEPLAVGIFALPRILMRIAPALGRSPDLGTMALVVLEKGRS